MSEGPAVRIVVRPLAAADAPAYKALRDACLARFPDAFTSDHASAVRLAAESYEARFGDPATGGFTLGAFADALLVGAITCERKTRVKEAHLAHIVGMMVGEHAQGRGIGRTLLDACTDVASSVAGIEALTLSVTASNTAAVRLYESAGFTSYGLLPRAINVSGVFHDKRLMRRSVGTAA